MYGLPARLCLCEAPQCEQFRGNCRAGGRAGLDLWVCAEPGYAVRVGEHVIANDDPGCGE